MPEELKTYVLEHPDVQKVFFKPAVGEHDSEWSVGINLKSIVLLKVLICLSSGI